MTQQTGAAFATSRPVEAVELWHRLQEVGIVIPEPDEVIAYLEAHPAIGPHLVSLCVEVRKEFPPPTELALIYYLDPEFEDNHLVLLIRPIDYREGLVEQIELVAARNDHSLAGDIGRVLVTTDFRKPGAAHVRMD